MPELELSLGAKPQIYIIFYSLPFLELKEASKQSICKHEYRALPSELHQCCYCYELPARYRGLFSHSLCLSSKQVCVFFAFCLEVQVCRAGTPPSRRGKIFTVPEILEVLTDADFGVFFNRFAQFASPGSAKLWSNASNSQPLAIRVKVIVQPAMNQLTLVRECLGHQSQTATPQDYVLYKYVLERSSFPQKV